MVPVIQCLSNDIEDAFEGSIRKKLEEGATTAENEASSTCSLWGSKVCHIQIFKLSEHKIAVIFSVISLKMSCVLKRMISLRGFFGVPTTCFD